MSKSILTYIRLIHFAAALSKSASFIPNLSHTVVVPTNRNFTSSRSVSMSNSNSNNDQPTNLLLSKISQISSDGSIRLILASKSPRRREILDMMGLSGRYSVIPSPLDESALQNHLATQSQITPEIYAQTLAREKAHALALDLLLQRQQEEEKGILSDPIIAIFILGSDTIVDYENKILEKPKDEADAIRMLSVLSGSWHQVHTGVALYRLSSSKVTLESSFTDTARVKFSQLSQLDIQSYVDTKEPMDKAGSYGIQGIGGQMIEKIEGDFFTVMGLPMHRVSTTLNQALHQLL